MQQIPNLPPKWPDQTQKTIFLQIAREGNWNVAIDNVTDETGVLSIVGPKSAAVFADSLVNKADVDTWKFLDAKKVSILSKNYCGD